MHARLVCALALVCAVASAKAGCTNRAADMRTCSVVNGFATNKSAAEVALYDSHMPAVLRSALAAISSENTFTNTTTCMASFTDMMCLAFAGDGEMFEPCFGGKRLEKLRPCYEVCARFEACLQGLNVSICEQSSAAPGWACLGPVGETTRALPPPPPPPPSVDVAPPAPPSAGAQRLGPSPLLIVWAAVWFNA
jgi:hypothetical protein